MASTIAQAADWKTLTITNMAAIMKKDMAPHPRLLLPHDEAQWKKNIEASPALRATRDKVFTQAESMLAIPPVEYKKEGRRLQVQSICFRRVACLSMAFRLSGDMRFAKRAEQEMLAAAAFPDWNPSHFLDTAEMTMALAVGYDWLYASLSTNSRDIIRTVIVSHGIMPSFGEHRPAWVKGHMNWNQVCHAGMLFGALAIADEEPELAAQITHRAVTCLNSMDAYMPDGAYPEGPGYWTYGSTFNVLLIAALESSFGTDFGLATRQGFLSSADYMLHVAGPSGLWYNYSDCGVSNGVNPALFWIAAKRKEPSLLWSELPKLEKLNRKKVSVKSGDDRHVPLILVWGVPATPPEPPAAQSWMGRGPNPVAMHRASWKDTNAVFVGIKGGRATVNHGHQDAGVFVFEAGGVRWGVDLGVQKYHSLESKGVDLWGKQRWEVFRHVSLAHSVLVVDGKLQVTNGNATIIEHTASPQQRTVVEMSEVYKDQLAAARRAVTLIPGGILIKDTIRALTNQPCSVRWAMVTEATFEKGTSTNAALVSGGKRLSMTFDGAKDARWETYSTEPPHDYDAPNPGTCLVGFTTELSPGETRIMTVRLILDTSKAVQSKQGRKKP